MTSQKLRQLVQSTGDAAFIVDGQGVILAWNSAAEEYFGIPAVNAVGNYCLRLLQGSDECGAVCAERCLVRQAVRSNHPVRNFDVQVVNARGRQWCNISVVAIEDQGQTDPYALHILRPIDVRKRLEMVMRDFVRLEVTGAEELMPTPTRLNAGNANLTERETKVLAMLSRGFQVQEIGVELHISRATVSNHIQHAMTKLGAHTRLEAVRKAEMAGLI